MAEFAARRRNRLLLTQWSELLEQDAFRRFFLMRLASTGAVNALAYAMLVFTVRQSSSAIATGALVLTILVPSALLGAIAGVVVDRVPRGLILVTSYALRAGLMLALIEAKDSLPSLYAVSLGLGLIAQFTVPTEAAVLPQIVRPERLTAANSFLALGIMSMQALGVLVVAPVLLKTTNGDPLLLVLMGLFALSTVLVSLVPQFEFASQRRDDGRLTLSGARRQFAESWMTLARDSTAYLALALGVVASTTTLVLVTLLPKFSVHVLGIRPENIVFVLVPLGLTIFFGLRCVEWLETRFDRLATVSGAYVLLAGSMIALGFVPESARLLMSVNPLGVFEPGPLDERAARIAATVFYSNVYGFGLTVVLTMGRVILNERVPLRMQGRVFAAQGVLANLVAIAPVVLAGILADAVGVAPVLVAAGLAVLFAAAWSRAQSSRVVAATG